MFAALPGIPTETFWFSGISRGGQPHFDSRKLLDHGAVKGWNIVRLAARPT